MRTQIILDIEVEEGKYGDVIISKDEVGGTVTSFSALFERFLERLRDSTVEEGDKRIAVTRVRILK